MAFWRRHTRLGVALCIALPLIAVVRIAVSPSGEHDLLVLSVAVAVAGTSPLLLLVPVERLVRHPRGRIFYDLWEGVGIALVMFIARFDGGARSPYVTMFFVLLAHAALAYPPVGMFIAGSANIAAYLLVGLLAGDPAGVVVVGALALALATGTCAFASWNHVIAYRRTAAYARQIAVLAARDGLTGCLNHRTFHERLQAEAGAADRDRPLALLIVDVDDFKHVNDTLGHPAGDSLLQLLGRLLAEAAGEDDAPGRLGGDEFALLLPETSAVTATRVAQALCEQVRGAADAYGVTVSIGVAATTSRADATGLLAAADRAVYRAKREGRDRVCAAEPALPATPRPRASVL